ncbi:MAG: tetratricopeptide repeat protein [Cyanobacteria bacterium J06642_11]
MRNKYNSWPQSSPHSEVSPLFAKVVYGAGLLGLAGLSLVLTRIWHTTYLFDRAESAYEAGDCSAALPIFNRFAENGAFMETQDIEVRSLARKNECERYQSFAEAEPQLSPMELLRASSDFLDSYPTSALDDFIRGQVDQQIADTPGETLAVEKTCDRIDSIKTHQLIPNGDTQTPLLMQACGELYSNNQNFDQAITLYDQFLNDYPTHAQLTAVEASLAKTLVAQANAENPGEIPPPPLSGYTRDGSTVVTIRNDSPEAMRIVFSGAEPKFQELAPCEDCEVFSGNPPESCPERGPEAQFVIEPGQYDVLVRSIGARSVTPFTGTWGLGQGSEYYSCFYIVQSPAVES